MAKSKNLEVTVEVKVDSESIVKLLEPIRDHHVEALKNIDSVIAKYKGEEPDDHEKIYIIDAAAIPAGYYLRASVVEAITLEIAKDYLLTGELAAGASLTNEVEARHGKTDQISDQENDNSERGAGSEDPNDSENNGSGAGSSDPDPSGPRS